MSDVQPRGSHRADQFVAVGLYLMVAGVYMLLGPGRIDMIDGQFRFEVGRSLLEVGQPLIRDPDMPSDFALMGVDGVVSAYGATVSVLTVPLLWLGRQVGLSTLDAQQLLFSWLSGLVGAFIVPVQFLLHRTLGVARQPAVAWALVTAFCTQLFVTSTTVFDQPMHALWILLAVGCTWLAGKRDSLALAAVAGLAMALLVNHQEVYAPLLPFVLLALVPERGWRLDRRSLAIAAVVLAGLGLGLAAWAGWNVWRLGEAFRSGKGDSGYQATANPILAGLTLLVSPGKGVLWYSAPVVLGLAGLPGMWRRARGLTVGTTATALALLGLYALPLGFSGDWCWGPRYMVPSVVLVGLAMPFARVPRPVIGVVVALGLGVQALGLSLDHHRFFQDRGLVGAVVDTDPDYYWTASALAARPGEILTSLQGLPEEVERFASHPYEGRLTFMTWGLGPPGGVEQQRKYAVFWLPRPWPLWMAWLPEDVPRPVPARAIASGLGLGAVLGAGLVLVGLRREGHAAPSRGG